jgi:hypothetical protein
VLAVLRAELRKTHNGLLADATWSESEGITIVRVPPAQTPAGKLFPIDLG